MSKKKEKFNAFKFDLLVHKKLVDIAEKILKGVPEPEVIKQLYENDDKEGLFSLGILLGACICNNGDPIFFRLMNNYMVITEKLKKGIKPETIKKEIEEVVKEAYEQDYKTFGRIAI